MMEITDLQKIGVGLVGFGAFFLLFGILLYMDSVLLAFGNILFLSGLAIIIGLKRTFGFFFQRQKLKGTSFFLGGILIVLLRWPVLGMVLETYGFINLFSCSKNLEIPALWYSLDGQPQEEDSITFDKQIYLFMQLVFTVLYP
uniref:Vesicle transport protein GOT1A n=1 Tax=Sphaerodactylus townsendi TaxID=933632 RepID=A0ACB8F533_9SAUR